MTSDTGPGRDRRLRLPPGAASGQRGGVSSVLRAVLLSEYFILYLTVVYFLFLVIFIPGLASPRNLSNQLSNVWPLFVVSMGQTLVLLIAGIDLSLGSIMGFVSVCGALVMAQAANQALLEHSPAWGSILTADGGAMAGQSPALAVAVAVAVMLVLGAAIGFINGWSVAKFKMPPFMVTLVSMFFFFSAAVWITQSQNIVNLPDEFTTLGSGDVVSFYFGEKAEPQIPRREILPFVTYPMLIAIGLAVALHLLLSRTIFGRHVYAVGANPKTAELSGVPVERVIVWVFVLAGICAAIASVLYSARLAGGRPTLGYGSVLLDIIGATVIGGTSFAGGKGKIAWTFVGVVFFVMLANTLNYMRLSAFHIDVVKGTIILAAAFLDVLRTRLLTREASG